LSTVCCWRMTDHPSTDYPTELLRSYEETRIRESFFSHLALFHDGSTKHALRRLAHVERIMSDALVPFVRTRCSHLTRRAGDVLYLSGICEANELCTSSNEWVTQLAATFTLAMADIVRLQRFGAFAPAPERAVLQQHLEHEQAIVDTLQALAGPSSESDGACASIDGWIVRYSS
jgi:hypothetical protein